MEGLHMTEQRKKTKEKFPLVRGFPKHHYMQTRGTVKEKHLLSVLQYA